MFKSICLWTTLKKKPVFTQAISHGFHETQSSTEGLIQTPRWVTALASLRYSDIIALANILFGNTSIFQSNLQAVLSKPQFKKSKVKLRWWDDSVGPPVYAQNSRAVSVAADPNSGTPITVEVRDMDIDGVPLLAIGGYAQASGSSSGVGT